MDHIKQLVITQGGQVAAQAEPEPELERDADGNIKNPFFKDGKFNPQLDVGKQQKRLSDLVPDWTDEQIDVPVTVYTDLQGVPQIDPDYIVDQAALADLALHIENSSQPAWLVGPQSCGKSSIVKYFSALTGRPFIRIDFQEDMSQDELFGNQSASEGTTKYHFGQIPQAMRTPHALILFDEPVHATAETQLLLQHALEVDGKLYLSNYPADMADRWITWEEDTHVVMAANTTGQGDASGFYVGTKQQNSAWLDRVGLFLKLSWLPQAHEIKILHKKAPEATEKLLIYITNTAILCRKGFEDGDLSCVLSMRVTQAWAQLACQTRDPKRAFELTFVNRFDDETEAEAAREIYRNVFGCH
jgi:cobaltochelatase CobS